jgi:hypothetical protein
MTDILKVIDDMVIWIEPDPDHFQRWVIRPSSIGLSYSPESARSDAEKVVFALLHRRSADFKTL